MKQEMNQKVTSRTAGWWCYMVGALCKGSECSIWDVPDQRHSMWTGGGTCVFMNGPEKGVDMGRPQPGKAGGEEEDILRIWMLGSPMSRAGKGTGEWSTWKFQVSSWVWGATAFQREGVWMGKEIMVVIWAKPSCFESTNQINWSRFGSVERYESKTTKPLDVIRWKRILNRKGIK